MFVIPTLASLMPTVVRTGSVAVPYGIAKQRNASDVDEPLHT